MEELTLVLKDNKGNIVKTVKATTLEIRFGTIDKLMELLDIDENTTSFELLKKVSTAWKELVEILNGVFPDMGKEDWNLVKINDLIPLLLQIIKYTFSEIMGVPSNSKN